MDKLDKTYEAVAMLETLGLPVSIEQRNAIDRMEKDYLQEEIIPLLKQELEPMVEKLRNQFNMKALQIKEYIPIDGDGNECTNYTIDSSDCKCDYID